MAKCPNCHVTIEEGQTYCGNCRIYISWKNGEPFISRIYAVQKALWIVWIGAVVFVVLTLLRGLSAGQAQSNTQTGISRTQVRLTVDKATYSYNYLVIEGTVKNTGEVAVYSPKIRCVAKDGEKTVGADTAYPAGYMSRDFKPGESAAITFRVHIQGNPASVKYAFEAEDFILLLTQ